MIRINLLPIRVTRRVQIGRRHLIVYVVVVIASIVALVVVHKEFAAKDTSAMEAKIQAVRRRTRSVQAKTGDVDELRAVKKKYKKRMRAFRKVLSGCYCTCGSSKLAVDCASQCPATERMQRTCPGPVLWMRELSHILSERWGPTLKDGLDPTKKLDYYDPNWDPTGLWLTSFEEEDGQAKIMGGAKANGDVAEFERRLRVSRYFDQVRVDRTSLVEDRKTQVKYYRFEISAMVVL